MDVACCLQLVFLLFSMAKGSVVQREVTNVNRNFTSEELGVAQSAYQQFWAKLESIMGPNRQDFLGVLARNKGDLLTTINSFQTQLGDSYGFLTQTYKTFEPLWSSLKWSANATQNVGSWTQTQFQQLGSTTASKVYTWWDWISRKFADMWSSIAPSAGSKSKASNKPN